MTLSVVERRTTPPPEPASCGGPHDAAPKSFVFGADVVRDLDRASSLEWFETNGLGGYAAGTVAGVRTRRYHGLLFSSAAPPADRRLLLAAYDVSLHLDGRRFDLATHRYGDVVHPEGYRLLASFRTDPFPTRTWTGEGWALDEETFLPRGRDAVAVRWTLRAVPGAGGAAPSLATARLEVRPLVAARDDHALTRRNDALDPTVRRSAGGFEFRPYAALPAIRFSCGTAEIGGPGVWYEGFRYDEERRRGFDHVEDLFSPCALAFAIGRSGEATCVAGTDPVGLDELPALRAAEVSRRDALAAAAPSSEPCVRALAVAADRFVVRRGEGPTLVAGYPWFVDWGRDAMIALPGLLLATGRAADARGVLATFASYLDGGMLPNRFPDRGATPEYNTVDAALWFAEAARAYVAATDDDAFLRATLLPAVRAIVAAHVAGTRHGVRVDDEGFLRAGEPGVQLTWMDAKVGDRVITPRHGRPVEIQALWFNALRTLAAFERRAGTPEAATAADRRADALRAAFEDVFWNAPQGCLFDVVGDDGAPDASVRPNQLFAVSLFHPLLEGPRAQSVVATVERKLLTPVGLRTLSPCDRRYVGRYEGGPAERDAAYHQGAVWPWLFGAYADAFLRVHGRSRGARTSIRRRLLALLERLGEAGLGSLSELHDGDPPHAPRGCFAQAWSVAEALRVAKGLA